MCPIHGILISNKLFDAILLRKANQMIDANSQRHVEAPVDNKTTGWSPAATTARLSLAENGQLLGGLGRHVAPFRNRG